jgi:sugar phosphate isomerase/epimerase
LAQGTLDLKQIASTLRRSGYQGVCSLECFVPNSDEQILKEELAKAKALFS